MALGEIPAGEVTERASTSQMVKHRRKPSPIVLTRRPRYAALFGLKDFLNDRGERGARAFLVDLAQSAIADDIGYHDGCKPPLHNRSLRSRHELRRRYSTFK